MCKCVNSDFAGATLKKQVDLFRDKLPVVTPTAPVPVHGCLLLYHSPARKIEETSDGVEVYSTILTPSQSITYNVPVTLAVGSKVDFTVNQVANQSYDVTGFTAQIIR